ncbi:MAG TPA: hypothetical protein VG867_01100 [Rhizomicrobium sp.]|nr:hypothetical protein [Rhizomicrobium sp.]
MKMVSVLAVLVLAFTAGQAVASWKFPAQVRYENDDGFTPWSRAVVTFATGGELNLVTKSLKYDNSDARYMVVPMTSGDFNVIRLSGFVPCGGRFTQACLPGGRGDGFDGQGRHWQVCTNPKCS